ncbi:MAG: Gfo/Idh/MocA family oxidoreductase [Candidatus Omnitrophica bacterium]|nr:Gfo/Idh/MocA family oxidoreductase [Candidatus Omnitrophota bacterium]
MTHINDRGRSIRKKTTAETTRRRFLKKTIAASTLTIMPSHVLSGFGRTAPNDKTTLACIGVGGRGYQNLRTFLRFDEIQIVSVCDVNRESDGYISWDWEQGRETKISGREPSRRTVDEFYAEQNNLGQYKACSAYSDYRELLEKEDVDAVMVAAPDHAHAVITMAALKKRKHVYCEKPLTWSVKEARLIAEEAKRAGVATQLGNQGQATEEDRLTREIIASGVIGHVHEVHVAISPRFWHWPAMLGRPEETPTVPEGLDWDLWLGPAPFRPYHPEYHPWTWRNWWDFGTGQLGDLGCHRLSTVFKALHLKHPISVEASSTKRFPDVYPLGVIARFEFPARGDMPPVILNWYDGGLKPPHPKDLEANRGISNNLYIGEKGTVMGHQLIPESKMKTYGQAPKTLPRSPGHFDEWVNACRGGDAPGSNFVDHAGFLTETCMLGNAALQAGRKLYWDGPNMKFTNDDNANQFLHREYRDGWT